MSKGAAANRPDRWFVPWWLVLIEGIALVILGLLFLASPALTALLAVSFLGIYWLISGVLRIVSIFLNSTAWGWELLAGLVGIIAGILVIRHPLWSTLFAGTTLIVLLGIGSIIIGAITLYQAFKGAGWGAGILGVVSILIGLFLLANILAATLAVPWVLGILAIAGGILAIIMAFRLRRMDKEYEAASFAAPRASLLDVGQGMDHAAAVEGGEAGVGVSAAAAGMAERALTGAPETGADSKAATAGWGDSMADATAETIDRAGDLGPDPGTALVIAAESAVDDSQATVAGVATAAEESATAVGGAAQPSQGPGFP